MTIEKPTDGQHLPEHSLVLRLPRPPKSYTPGEQWIPDWELFVPSSGDKDHASAHGKPVRVSVWDNSKTTIAQARAFRAGPTLVVQLKVSDATEVGASTGHLITVVYDPLDPPDDSRPGSEGHAGIEGLKKPDGEA